MTIEDVATKVADNALLRSAGRLMWLIGIPVAAWYLGQQSDALGKQGDLLQALATRVSVVETNQQSGKERGDALRAQVKELNDNYVAVSQKLAEIGTDVGYLRRWVEEQKRDAQ